MDEKSKIIEVGEKRGSKATAKVSVTEVTTLDLAQRNAFRKIRQAGELIAPFGCAYLGSAVVHYYKEKFSNPSAPVYKVATQAMVQEIDEGFADFGHKQLKTDLMRQYGRKLPEVRQDFSTEKD